MPLLEYKLERTHEGNKVPGFVEEHLGYRDGRMTYVGWVRSPENRKFYVPDTVTVLSKEDFITREINRLQNSEEIEDPSAAAAQEYKLLEDYLGEV